MSEQPKRAAMAPPANDNDSGVAVRFTGEFPPPVSPAELALFEAHAGDLLALLVSAANDNDSTLARQHGHDADDGKAGSDEGAGP